MHTIWLDEVDSTNSYLERTVADIKAPAMVIASCQTAGRGQRGNTWESESGRNLTFSVLFRPKKFPAAEQFAISEATALAVVDFLALHEIKAKVKWPNDIYVGDRKICGMLIKHSLMGNEISHSILGVGVNVNQTQFLSDAPNPVSMTQITGKTYGLDAMASEIAVCIEKRLPYIEGTERIALHNEFLGLLWRGDGETYLFRDSAKDEIFFAVISDVDMHGVLSLTLPDATCRQYRFKEVSYIF